MVFCAGLPSGGGYATLQEITPPRMRAQMTALNGLMVNLIGAGIGPLIVGALTFLPVLALGPIAEHVSMLARQAF